MFIRTTKGKTNKKTYVYLVEGYRDINGRGQQRIVKKYGTLEDLINERGENALEELKAEISQNETNIIKEASVNLLLNEKAVDNDNLTNLQNFGWYFLDAIYSELKISDIIKDHSQNRRFKYDLDSVLKLLVYRRIIAPSSKLQTFKDQNKMLGKWEIKQYDVYKALDELNEIKDKIQIQIDKVVKDNYNRTGTLAFYDVTNYYWASDRTDDILHDQNGEITHEGLRYFGFSKEKRKKPIVQMGLFMDSNGVPICYKLFRGNLPDVSTYAEIINEFKEKFGYKTVTIVADKAMNSKKNVMINLKNGDNYLFSQKFRGTAGISKDVHDFVLEQKDFHWDKDKRYKTKSRVFERKLLNGETVKERVVVVYSKDFANRQQHELDEMIKITNDKLKTSQNELRRQKKFSAKYLIKEQSDIKIQFVLDNERIEKYKQWQGLNVIVTSNVNMSSQEVLAKYHELWQIEESFKITKSDLQGRPVFVNLKEHIEGHFLTCFISLVLLRLLQLKTSKRISVKKIIDGIKSLNCAELTDGYYLNVMDENSNNLALELGVDINKKYIKAEELRNLLKK